MKKKTILVVVGLGLISLVVLASAWLHIRQKNSSLNVPAASPAVNSTPITSPTVTTKQEPKGTIFVSPATDSFSVNRPTAIKIKLKTDNQPLSSIAVRLTAKFDQTLPMLFKNRNPQGLFQVTPNPNLTSQGWIYPVNTIKIDRKNKIIAVEFAMINPKPQPPALSPEEVLAIIEFIPQRSTQSLVFKFDQKQTQVFTKKAQKIQLQAKDGVYIIQ